MKTNRIAIFAMALGAATVLGYPVAAEEDHLKGYKIKDLSQVAPPGNPYVVTNEFGSESCDLKKPQFMLVQSEKNGGDDTRGGEPGNFVCYKAKCTGTLPPQNILDSQFGEHIIETKKAKLVCLPVDPPSPSCAGVLVGGFCWFLGAPGDSCDATCAAQSSTCDAATVTYAGSGGDDSNCQAVMVALGNPGFLDYPSEACAGSIEGVGCAENGGETIRCAIPATTCGTASAGTRRACACQ